MILTLLLPRFEKMINLALQSDVDALVKIATIQNQTIEINCIDWNVKFYIHCQSNQLQFEKQSSHDADTFVSGTLNHFLHLFISGADPKTLFHYPIDINGNSHNIEVLRDIFKNLNWDLEEKLSTVLGDALAHKIFFHTKATKEAAQKTTEKIIEQIKEYIHFEAKNLVSTAQTEQFYTDVAKLRDDIDRLEMRL